MFVSEVQIPGETIKTLDSTLSNLCPDWYLQTAENYDFSNSLN